MKVYFVRHGKTNYNVLDLYDDDPTKDVHLTELGKEQAKIVSERLKDKKFDVIFISELPRTGQTAEIINKHHHTPIKIDKRLDDRHTGFEGRPVSEFKKLMGKDPVHLKLKSGESFEDEERRVFSFLDDLKNSNYNTVLVVAHEDTLKIIEGYFKHLTDKEIYKEEIGNCQILKFNI